MNKIIIILIAVLFATTSFYKKEGISTNNTKNFDEPKSEFPAKNKMKSTTISADEIFSALSFDRINILNSKVFSTAYLGFLNLKKAGQLSENSHLLTVCDFSLSSSKKRLWVIDLNEKKVIFNTLVAHGKNSGEEFAQKFSNTESSYQSSMGFYITENTYIGNNGFSLKLLGMDSGYNDAALQRAIVMHGANYVSEEFIKNQKRLGRSWGCPAVPKELAEPIINTIKGENCLFIYFPEEQYLSSSKWLKTEDNS